MAHLQEEPGVEVERVALMLGAVVLGRDVCRRHQLPAGGVEVAEDAGEEGGGIQLSSTKYSHTEFAGSALLWSGYSEIYEN